MPRQDCEKVLLVLVFLIATMMQADVGIVISPVVLLVLVLVVAENIFNVMVVNSQSHPFLWDPCFKQWS
jgi:hypothetical protein